MSRGPFTALSDRVSGEGVDTWEVHSRARARVAAGEDVIVLSVGEEQTADTAGYIVEAGVAAIREGRSRYTGMRGIEPLRRAIAEDFARRTGKPVDAGNVVVLGGAQNGLFAVSLTLLQAGDEVIVPEPYYTTYPATFTAGGAAMVPVPTRAEDGFHIDPDALAAAVTPRTRAIVLNSPNNPTGAVYGAEALAAVAEICREHGLWLISDEVYADMSFDGGFVSPSQHLGLDEGCVVVSSVSKAYRMTGWRVGWAVADAAVCERLANLALCMTYGLPEFTQRAALAALTGDRREATESRRDYKARAELVRRAFAGLNGVHAPMPQGGMFVMLDVRALTDDAQPLALEMLDAIDVSVLPCGGFGKNFKGFLRMALCVDEGRLREACTRIAGFLQGRGA